MRRTLASLVALAGLAAAAPASADAAIRTDVVRDCDTYASYPNVLISSVRNMRCRAARRDMRRYDGAIFRRFSTPGGFRCRRVSGTSLGGQWRCVKGDRAYRFEFGD